MASVKKTNAIRILETLKIPYEAKAYDDDGEHPLAKGAANRTAEKLGIDPATVYKTIIMRTDTKELCVFLQSSLHEINLKKARNAVGCKEINPIKPEELLSATGYVRGGCSPLGMKKKLRTFIDSSAMNLEKLHISAGIRGMQLSLAPADLVKACNATVVDLILE
ncbi:MAG: Cys-tRNA(Pro) deacylase [Treponema sp.]|nr:Cys-tRNA(Pro) deacylase [Treponema sp.]